jgi:hypothetical protein
MNEDSTENQDTESFPPASAGRPPTSDEAAAAERAADDVDIAQVAEHYQEMTELGKNVRGEGAVTPGS